MIATISPSAQIVPARAGEHRRIAQIHGERLRLYDKLSREVLQSEHDAHLHSFREAQRQDGPPARILTTIGYHAQRTEPELRKLVTARQPFTAVLALAVAKAFSNVRYYAADHLLARERTYRATLLGLRHGLDAAYLLRAAADRAQRTEVHDFCDRLIAEREPLLNSAVEVITWFADHPSFAMQHR
jgi:hypothetical protein